MKADRDEAVSRYDNTLSELEAHVKVIAPQNRDDDVLKAHEVLGVAQYVFERALRVLCKYPSAGEMTNYARKYLRYVGKRHEQRIHDICAWSAYMYQHLLSTRGEKRRKNLERFVQEV